MPPESLRPLFNEKLVNGRAPARCRNGHVHEFDADGQRYRIHSRQKVRPLPPPIRVRLHPPYANDRVDYCIVCYTPLETIEEAS